jgi:hypothetical protein
MSAPFQEPPGHQEQVADELGRLGWRLSPVVRVTVRA